jgi:hypothetical protein
LWEYGIEMSTKPSPITWAKVKYTVVYSEERIVEFPVACEYDLEDIEHMIQEAEARALVLRSKVMTDDFLHDYELRMLKPEIQALYPADEQGEIDREHEQQVTRPLPVPKFTRAQLRAHRNEQQPEVE